MILFGLLLTIPLSNQLIDSLQNRRTLVAPTLYNVRYKKVVFLINELFILRRAKVNLSCSANVPSHNGSSNSVVYVSHIYRGQLLVLPCTQSTGSEGEKLNERR
ncbi:hypothetical protein D3C81_1686050 [compost metagenome]